MTESGEPVYVAGWATLVNAASRIAAALIAGTYHGQWRDVESQQELAAVSVALARQIAMEIV